MCTNTDRSTLGPKMGSKMTRPHRRTEQAGLRLIHHLAPAVAKALDDLQREQHQCDGWPNHGSSPGRSSSDTSTTEAAALQADNFGGRAEEILDTVESIEISVGHLAKLVIGIDRTPAAGEEKRCSDGQVGRDALKWSTDEQCKALPVRLGMCNAHYFQHYRFRVANHLPVDQYFEDGA